MNPPSHDRKVSGIISRLQGWILSLRAPTAHLPALPAVPSTSRVVGHGHRRVDGQGHRKRRRSNVARSRSGSKYDLAADVDANGDADDGESSSSRGRAKCQGRSRGQGEGRRESGSLYKSLCDSMVKLNIDNIPVFQDEDLKAELLAGEYCF